jgi:serine/threonine-protein kinase
MPYVEGESLRARLRREAQLPLDEAVQIAREVADALTYAHAHGVVHRDIKPENILLAGGHALVVDFGIARAITAAGTDRLTESGLVIGTPAYMSPEQSSGSQTLDGRSDLYSLACVVYEMLAGEPPYTGPSGQAIIAKRLTEPVPHLRTVREAVPDAVEQVVTKALAKVPADRFASATVFADALSHGLTTPLRQRTLSRRTTALLVGITMVAAAGGGLLLRHAAVPLTLDVDAMAVAPFDVFAPTLALWREGLMDLLSRNLDGAGPLKTVSPSLVVRRWQGRADATSARALGQRTGAGLAVFGQLVVTGTDSVRLNAALLDVASGRELGDVEGRDVASRMDRLADSIAVRLLRVLGRTRPIGVVRLASFGSVSVPAMKAFLQGEQYYRRNEMDSAVASYERAVELDSTFALALRRLWFSQWDNPAAVSYAMRAARFNHGLAPRESLLVSADSVFAAQQSAHMANGAMFGQLRHLLSTLEEAAHRYPNDPEIWFELGEARFHAGTELGLSQASVREAFDRAVALDSSFVPAYSCHTLQMLVRLGDVPALRRWMAANLARHPPGCAKASSMQLVATLLDPDQARSTAVARLLDTLPLDEIDFVSTELLAGWRDTAETEVRLARALNARAAATGRVVVDSFAGEPTGTRLAQALAYRGHLREAYATGELGHWMLFAELAILGIVPADSASAVFAHQLRTLHADVPFLAMVPLAWWALHRDSTSLRQAVRRADSLARPPLPPDRNRRWAYVAATGRAYLALARSDTMEAIHQFLISPDSLCGTCAVDHFTAARLLVAQGRYREAANRLKPQPPDPRLTAHLVLLELERGRISEHLGERETAIRAYRYVTEAWRRPDPELQPYASEARDALRRLGARD